MSRPLFQVGEEVILQSKTHPQFNGEYVVEEIFKTGDTGICRVTGQHFIVDSSKYTTFSHHLDKPLVLTGGNMEANVWESELKKKPKPSEDSFEELMTNLKRPEKRLEKI